MPDALAPRFKFGVLAPATNTVVQPEFDAMRPNGVTNQMARVVIPAALVVGVIGGLLKRPMTDSEFWTAELIKDVNNFDQDAIRQQARNWKV